MGDVAAGMMAMKRLTTGVFIAFGVFVRDWHCPTCTFSGRRCIAGAVIGGVAPAPLKRYTLGGMGR